MLINKVTEKLDIIVLGGQSNGEGYGLGPCDEPYRPNARILCMRDTDNYGCFADERDLDEFGIKMPREYLIGIAEERQANKGKIGCLALPFARAYERECLESDRRVLLIYAALGATGFNKGHWGVDKVLYKRLVRMCELALSMNEENRICAFLWHQGEHEVVFPAECPPVVRYSTHLGNMSALLSDYRSRFGDVPFISGGFTDEWMATHTDRGEPVINALKDLCARNERAAYVSSEGLLSNNQQLGNGDEIHFSRNSLYILGKRYFDAFKNMTSAQK